jgi:hypothetical protein
MKRFVPPSLAGMAILAGVLFSSGCASQCEATPDRLAALRRGMSYDETTQVMGCPGKVVSAQAPGSSGFATVEWDGPDERVGKRTQLDFQDGKLLSFTTERRGGW